MAQLTEPVMYGADVDSRHIEIVRHGATETVQIDNHPKAIRAWLKTTAGPAYLAVEATGPYHQALTELAHARSLKVYLVNPYRLSRYRDSIGTRAKTDRCDARLLARYLTHEHMELRAWTPLPKAQRAAWTLLKRRAKVVQISMTLEQSLHGMAGFKREIRSVKQRLKALEKAIEARLLAEIKALGWQEIHRRCCSIYGIGPLSAAALVIAFHRGDFASADAFVAFLGLDVRIRESGRYVGQARLTKQGDSEYRLVLYNAAMCAARHDLKQYYQRLTDRGLKSTQAYVAVARKLARIAFSLMKSGQSYQPERVRMA